MQIDKINTIVATNVKRKALTQIYKVFLPPFKKYWREKVYETDQERERLYKWKCFRSSYKIARGEGVE